MLLLLALKRKEEYAVGSLSLFLDCLPHFFIFAFISIFFSEKCTVSLPLLLPLFIYHVEQGLVVFFLKKIGGVCVRAHVHVCMCTCGRAFCSREHSAVPGSRWY